MLAILPIMDLTHFLSGQKPTNCLREYQYAEAEVGKHHTRETSAVFLRGHH
jgi:hypothetical protein